jgi:hypothetical protein
MDSLPKRILRAGALAGTLDISSAFLYYFIKTGRNPLNVLTYISSALLGSKAVAGDAEVMMLGLALHYFIAFSFTGFFFLIYPQLPFLRKNKWLTAAMYGLFAWCVMNLFVVPLTRIPQRPMVLSNALINIVILMLCIGLPVTLLARGFFDEKVPVRRNMAAEAAAF